MRSRRAGVKVRARLKVAVLEKEEFRYGVVVRPAYCVGLVCLKVYPNGDDLCSLARGICFAVGKALIMTGDIKRLRAVSLRYIIGKRTVAVVARCGRCAVRDIHEIGRHRAAVRVNDKLCGLRGNGFPNCGQLAVAQTECVCAARKLARTVKLP